MTSTAACVTIIFQQTAKRKVTTSHLAIARVAGIAVSNTSSSRWGLDPSSSSSIPRPRQKLLPCPSTWRGTKVRALSKFQSDGLLLLFCELPSPPLLPALRVVTLKSFSAPAWGHSRYIHVYSLPPLNEVSSPTSPGSGSLACSLSHFIGKQSPCKIF